MSYIRDMTKEAPVIQLAHDLGHMLRAERRRLGLTQAEVARRAGIGRQKLIQVEQGKLGVALAAYAAAMDALDLVPMVKPAEVRIAEYPQLKRLTWNRPGAEAIAERDALALYERHWELIDGDHLTINERNLVQRLVNKYGHGVLHV
jgi:transcriptional regulator with XRE-family HTH domain